MTEESGTSFGEEMRRRLVDEFVISYYNGSLKPNLAEKNPINGRDVEYLMDAPEFDRIRRSDVWSYGTAVGTGYQYKVVYKDRRYSDLEKLLETHSGTGTAAEEDVAPVEQRLYEMIMLMIREGRLQSRSGSHPGAPRRRNSLRWSSSWGARWTNWEEG